MLNLLGVLKKAREKPDEPSYKPVPLTLALRKRKQEEEQFARYQVKKEKKFEIQ